MAMTVFISHASADEDTALKICAILEGGGFPCWIASRDVEPGANYQSEIVQAIRSAKVMVLVFTANANDSDDILREVALASQHKLTAIPVRVENVMASDALTYAFVTAQWINLFDDWERGIGRLLSAVAKKVPREAVTGALATLPGMGSTTMLPGLAPTVSPGLELATKPPAPAATKTITRVFIGSTGLDLKDYREIARDLCLELRFVPIMMENFEAMGVGATAGSKKKLDEADLYVGIFAYSHGYIEQGYDKSIAEIEFDYAGERNIDRLCFVVDPTFPWPPSAWDPGTRCWPSGKNWTGRSSARSSRHQTISRRC